MGKVLSVLQKEKAAANATALLPPCRVRQVLALNVQGGALSFLRRSQRPRTTAQRQVVHGRSAPRNRMWAPFNCV